MAAKSIVEVLKNVGKKPSEKRTPRVEVAGNDIPSTTSTRLQKSNAEWKAQLTGLRKNLPDRRSMESRLHGGDVGDWLKRHKVLPQVWYSGAVEAVSEKLVGCYLVRRGGVTASGDSGFVISRIVETEAYHGTHADIEDPSAHSWGGERARTLAMHSVPGVLYVYRVHTAQCINISTEKSGNGCATLIRGIEPVHGIEEMNYRRKSPGLLLRMGNGPGCLTQAMGLSLADNSRSLFLSRTDEKTLTVDTTHLGRHPERCGDCDGEHAPDGQLQRLADLKSGAAKKKKGKKTAYVNPVRPTCGNCEFGEPFIPCEELPADLLVVCGPCDNLDCCKDLGEVAHGKRIGISKAKDVPWRFCASQSPFISKPIVQ